MGRATFVIEITFAYGCEVGNKDLLGLRKTRKFTGLEQVLKTGRKRREGEFVHSAVPSCPCGSYVSFLAKMPWSCVLLLQVYTARAGLVEELIGKYFTSSYIG
jgi:hypothetical protein